MTASAAGSAKVQFNVYLPPELVRSFKHRAVDEGRSLSAVVESALAAYLAGPPTGTSPKESR